MSTAVVPAERGYLAADIDDHCARPCAGVSVETSLPVDLACLAN
jgi:hypothetical protein